MDQTRQKKCISLTAVQDGVKNEGWKGQVEPFLHFL